MFKKASKRNKGIKGITHSIAKQNNVNENKNQNLQNGDLTVLTKNNAKQLERQNSKELRKVVKETKEKITTRKEKQIKK